jgi:hypothetical protein
LDIYGDAKSGMKEKQQINSFLSTINKHQRNTAVNRANGVESKGIKRTATLENKYMLHIL